MWHTKQCYLTVQFQLRKLWENMVETKEGTCGTAQMKNALTCFFRFQVCMK